MDLNCVLKVEEFEEEICSRQEIKREEEPHDIKQEENTEISIVVKQEEEIKQEHPSVGPLPSEDTKVEFGPLPSEDTKEGVGSLPYEDTKEGVGSLPYEDTKEGVGPLPSVDTKEGVRILPSEDVGAEPSEDVRTRAVSGYYVWGSIPFMFDPESDPEAEQEEATPAKKRRKGVPVSDWCTCGNCKLMKKESENICCQEIPQLTQRLGELANPVPGCMTDHPGFHPVCLNVYNLQRAFNAFRYHHGRLRIRSLKRRYKFLARWSLVTWCWGLQGREIRVGIPSCVALRIRREFPLVQGPDAPRPPPLHRRQKTTTGACH
ncbi:uncharacterized protein LOC134467491 [Engraulis encrasicolus]|uniref:uncharacterized protein LOC134467491 n=1 Tax=Engraulis encrasicolus TaxID=184585 RepID=UPI002FD5F9B5